MARDTEVSYPGGRIGCRVLVVPRNCDKVKYVFVADVAVLAVPTLYTQLILACDEDRLQLHVIQIAQILPCGDFGEVEIVCTFCDHVPPLLTAAHLEQLGPQLEDFDLKRADKRRLPDPVVGREAPIPTAATYAQEQKPLPPRPRRPTRLILQQREIDEVMYSLVQDLNMAVCGVGDGLKHDCQPGFKGIPLGLEVVSVLEPSCGDPWLVTVRILQEPSVTPATQAAFNRRMASYGFLPRA